MRKFLLLIPHFLSLLFIIYPVVAKSNTKEKIAATGLLGDRDDQMLLISTLDGALHAVSKDTGEKKWTLKDSPIIQNPDNLDQPNVPRFFPNPQDGSLYRYTSGKGGRDPLKKLPFTIPELVASSPCRSNDGIFYIGKKTDSWVGIDLYTGKKQFALGVDSSERVCPKPSRNTIYIGRTMYNIMFYELHSGNKWNVSFYEYSRNSDTQFDLLDHGQNHFAATGEGGMLTFSVKSGAPLWNLDLGSPVVAIYLLDAGNSLVSVPVTAVTPETLQRFTDQMNKAANMEPPPSEDMLIKEFRLTTYVGESENGVYALPALIDFNTARISKRENHLLLDGPEGQRGMIKRPHNENDDEESDFIVLGYYDSVDSFDIKIDEVGKTIAKRFVGDIPLGIIDKGNRSTGARDQSSGKGDLLSNGFKELKNLNVSFILSRDFTKFTAIIVKRSYHWVLEEPLHTIVTLLVTMMAVIVGLMFVAFKNQARFRSELSSKKLVSSSRGSNSGQSNGEVTAVAEELDTGETRVGKITYNPNQCLGKGCEGTFVYRGTFDGRLVAVKRLLPSCFSIADREVELLRAADQHPNVVRYFCMEQCREFRYIALELCTATLDDLACDRFDCDVPRLVLLHEATAGLSHLHSLDIVHRDVKPQNVLLSIPSAKGKTRAMISDFGLCKKLEFGRNSFSKRSGITGTDGWIAPELLNYTTARPTTKVDIFSLGCVFYYVLTKGKHPFGFLLDRQSNIINNKPNLSHLDDEVDVLPKTLIENMLKHAHNDRPPSSAVYAHPLFWSADNTLQFFQDVSDRVEKEFANSFVLRKLERGAAEVVREDWTGRIHPSVVEDLARFREYSGRSVRDLLRALRNKKNHYREMQEDARQILGKIPEEFVLYWTKLFPRLLIHSWYALQSIKVESIFSKYYCSTFSFKQDENLHLQTIRLSPNNRFLPPAGDNRERDRAPTKKLMTNRRQSAKNRSDGFDFLDSVLGPQSAKGPRRPPKHESETQGPPPVWLLHKPANTFEPNFVYESPKKKSQVVEDKTNTISVERSLESVHDTIEENMSFDM